MGYPDSRLDRSAVEGLSDDEYFWTLMEPAWDDPAEGTAGQAALAAVTYFIRDTENGGLHQSIWNRDGDEIDRVLRGFDLFGAQEHAGALRRALHLIFGDSAPVELGLRRVRMERLGRDWYMQNTEPLDDIMYGEQRLYPLFHAYIAAHPHEFFRG